MAVEAGTAVTFDQFCPVAMSLDALGNRWSLLLMRDMLWAGPQTRQGLIECNPGLSEHELDEATDRLIAHGLIHRLEEPKARFALTERGEGISQVISALFDFGLPLLSEVTVNDWMLKYALSDTARRRRLDLLEIEHRSIIHMTVDEADLCVEVSPGMLRVVEGHQADATLTMSGASLAALMGASTTAAELQATGRLHIVGDADCVSVLLELLPATH